MQRRRNKSKSKNLVSSAYSFILGLLTAAVILGLVVTVLNALAVPCSRFIGIDPNEVDQAAYEQMITCRPDGFKPDSNGYIISQ